MRSFKKYKDISATECMIGLKGLLVGDDPWEELFILHTHKH